MTFCQVCFAGADTVVRESLNAGIGVLLGVTAVVLGCFARFFFSLARRSREAAHLVGGASPAVEDSLFEASSLNGAGALLDAMARDPLLDR